MDKHKKQTEARKPNRKPAMIKNPADKHVKHEIAKASQANNPKPILHLNLRPFFLAGLWFILFTTPFLRGLFFQPEQLVTHMITAIAFGFCVYDQVLRRDVRLLRTPLDWAMLAVVAAYLLSLITAVHMREAIGAVLKMATFFMVYWMAFRAVRKRKDLDRLLIVAYMSGIGVALIGLGAATKLINVPGAIDNGIILSTFQYKNALAAYLVAINVIGLGLSVKTERLIPKIFYAGGNLLLVVVILATQSRGGWVMYPLAMAALIALIPTTYRWRMAYHLVIFLGIGMVTARIFYARLPEMQGIASVKYLLAGLVAVTIFQFLYHMLAFWLNRDSVNDSTRRLVAIGGISYFSLVLAIYLWYAAAGLPVATAKIVPGNVIARAGTISGYDPSFQDRLVYSRDALRIVKDYPITGAGGGGWNALYHQYASRLYWTTETHNNFFQTWVESGTIGFLALMAIWVNFVWLLIRFKRHTEEKKTRLSVSFWSASVAALALGFHSIIDFDLSLAAMGILLYSLIGAAQGLAQRILNNKSADHAQEVPSKASTGRANLPSARKLILVALGGTLIATIVVYPTYTLYAAGTSGAKAARALIAKDIGTAINHYEQAHRLDPFSASYSSDLTQILAVQAASEDDVIARYRAIEFAQKAAAAEPYNIRVRSTLFNAYSLMREYEPMVNEAKALAKSNPLEIANFEILARAHMVAANHYLEKGEPKKARKHLQSVIKLPSKLPSTKSEPSQTLELMKAQAADLLEDRQGGTHEDE